MRGTTANVLLVALTVAVLVLGLAGISAAATVTGTNGNDTLFFQGVEQQLTKPFDPLQTAPPAFMVAA
jgi:hypothetical protein